MVLLHLLFLVIFLISGYVSLGSLSGAVTLVAATAVMYIFDIHGVDVVQLIFMTVLAILSFYMHRGNIKRLLNGTENGFKNKK